jgi:hypothetical protein
MINYFGVLWELLTGKLPFAGLDIHQLILAVVSLEEISYDLISISRVNKASVHQFQLLALLN